MIDFKTIKVGDKVKVVGAGAPGFAKLGDELEIVKVGEMRVDAKRGDGEEAFFALTCGAARLELVTPNVEFRPLDAASSRPVEPGTQGYAAPAEGDDGQA